MKYYLSTFLGILISATLWAQAPQNGDHSTAVQLVGYITIVQPTTALMENCIIGMLH